MVDAFHILIIDDDDASRALIDTLIRRSKIGLSISTYKASSLAEAQACLKKNKIDLVILDIMLPDSYGAKEASAFIKKIKPIRTVVLSGLQDHESMLVCLNAGALDYFPKSIVTDQSIGRVIYELIIKQKKA